jgi:hypothetical protein
MEMSVRSALNLAAAALATAAGVSEAPTALAQVSAQDSAPRGVVSSQAPPSNSSVVAAKAVDSAVPSLSSANGPPLSIGTGKPRPLSGTQCARIRDKVERDASLQSTYQLQLKSCASGVRPDEAVVAKHGINVIPTGTTDSSGTQIHDAPPKASTHKTPSVLPPGLPH